MSNTMIIRYTVSPESADENQRLIAAVFAELAEKQPEGMSYTAFRLEDGVSFVHVFSSETAESPLGQLEAFKDFQRGIGERVQAPPAAAKAVAIGSYGTVAA